MQIVVVAAACSFLCLTEFPANKRLACLQIYIFRPRLDVEEKELNVKKLNGIGCKLSAISLPLRGWMTIFCQSHFDGRLIDSREIFTEL